MAASITLTKSSLIIRLMDGNITITKEDELGEMKPAWVNWSTWGGANTERAAAFSEAMSEAVFLARKMDEVFKDDLDFERVILVKRQSSESKFRLFDRRGEIEIKIPVGTQYKGPFVEVIE